jgi:hypothetical protein
MVEVKREGAAMTFNLTHARHDTAHCLAPGLFRSLKRGDRKKYKLEVIYEFGENKSLRFYGFEPLDDLDMRVLQGIVAMAGPQGVILDLNNPKSEAGKQLSLFLEPKWDALENNTLVVKGSFYSLAKEIGYKDPGSGQTLKDIRESIERLWKVSIIARDGSRKRGFRMLSDYSSDEEEKRLFVALNPLISEAVLGDRQYTKISLAEVRGLKTSPARLMHQRLCGFINHGKTHLTPIDINTLCGYVWYSVGSKSAIAQRRTRIRKAINELIDVGWAFNEETKNKYKITRPFVE